MAPCSPDRGPGTLQLCHQYNRRRIPGSQGGVRIKAGNSRWLPKHHVRGGLRPAAQSILGTCCHGEERALHQRLIWEPLCRPAVHHSPMGRSSLLKGDGALTRQAHRRLTGEGVLKPHVPAGAGGFMANVWWQRSGVPQLSLRPASRSFRELCGMHTCPPGHPRGDYTPVCLLTPDNASYVLPVSCHSFFTARPCGDLQGPLRPNGF